PLIDHHDAITRHLLLAISSQADSEHSEIPPKSLYIGNMDSPTLHPTRQFGVPKAADGMIVDHPRSLHKGVADGGTHETKFALLQRLAHGVRFRACRRNVLERADGVNLRLASDKLPDVAFEAPQFFLHGQDRAVIAYGRFDLQAVADDARIGQQFLNFLFVVARDLFRIEIVEGGPKSFTLAKDDLP